MSAVRLLSRRQVVHAALVGAGSVVAAGCAADGRPNQAGSASTTTVTATGPTPTPRPARSDGADRPRVLVAFFSRAEENYYYGERTDLEVGNTAVVAGLVRDALAEVVDVDVFEIEAEDPYSEDYDATVARNVREQETDARPRIVGTVPDAATYDVVLVGSGIWNVRPR